MLKFFKKKPEADEKQGEIELNEAALVIENSEAENTSKPEKQKTNLFARLTAGLKKTHDSLSSGVANIFLGKKQIDDELLEALETQLLVADVGVQATESIIQMLTDDLSRKELKDSNALFATFRHALIQLLSPSEVSLNVQRDQKPFVLLVIGVNGSGKTTSIGKIAKKYQAEGHSIMLAAGDTFRAAAIDQLKIWGQRNDVPVIAQDPGADSASVIYDALEAATARGVDILIADTAGRLHTQSNLMEELKKVKRVLAKQNEEAPHETLLILDAGIGQNALVQAEKFHEALGVTGIALTKMDGTAKGGIIFAIAKQLGLPIRFIGVGESIGDLQPFKAEEFVDALLKNE